MGLFSRPVAAKKKQFLSLFGLRHLVMSPIVINLRKLSTATQQRTFPYPTASKSFLYFNAFMAKFGRTNSDVQKRDVQTNRQTKNSTFLATPAAGEIGAPPNLVW